MLQAPLTSYDIHDGGMVVLRGVEAQMVVGLFDARAVPAEWFADVMDGGTRAEYYRGGTYRGTSWGRGGWELQWSREGWMGTGSMEGGRAERMG